MGTHAAESTSQKRNSSTPTAVAFSRALSVGVEVRNRPIGNPNKMVTPAMKPSNMVDIKFIGPPYFAGPVPQDAPTCVVTVLLGFRGALSVDVELSLSVSLPPTRRTAPSALSF